MRVAILIAVTMMLTACTSSLNPPQLPADNDTGGIQPIIPSPYDSNGSEDTILITQANGSSGPAVPIDDYWNDSYDDGCNSDDDCLLVRAGYCGGARGILNVNLDEWNEYLAKDDAEGKAERRQCGISLPLSYYEARCVDTQCKAVQIKNVTSD
jgi:hypothetical protein